MLNNWLDLNGKRFFELKRKGGKEIIKDSSCHTNLSIAETAEFNRLLGQLEWLYWILLPPDPNEAKEFRGYIKKFFKQAEKEYKIIRNIQRGYE